MEESIERLLPVYPPPLPGIPVRYFSGTALVDYLKPGRLVFYRGSNAECVLDVDMNLTIIAVEIPRMGYCITNIKIVDGIPQNHIVAFGGRVAMFHELLWELGFNDFTNP